MTTITTLYILFFVSMLKCAQAQSAGERAATGYQKIEPLAVGMTVPDTFWTQEHLFFINGDTIRMNLNKYKGKLLILDSWASWCATCLQNFAKNSQLKREFGNALHIVLVNSTTTKDKLDQIDKVLSNTTYFEGAKEGSIVFDQYLHTLFPYTSLPRYVWIDPAGMVRAISTFDFVTSAQIQTLLNRKYFHLQKGAGHDE